MTAGEAGLTLARFVAHAIAIEDEAAQRYGELAAAMEVHNNPRVAQLFSRLARLEAEHADRLRTRYPEAENLAPWEFRWSDAESPESVGHEDTHYLMTARHALELALAGERRARAFFESMAVSAADASARRLAAEMAADEAEHARMVERALDGEAPVPDGWDDDTDPAVEPS